MATTIEWSKERVGAGRYFVRSAADGYRIAGLVIGGRGRWCVERGGRQWPTVYPSAAAACAALWDARQMPDAPPTMPAIVWQESADDWRVLTDGGSSVATIRKSESAAAQAAQEMGYRILQTVRLAGPVSNLPSY
jgi:hypothetical protein